MWLISFRALILSPFIHGRLTDFSLLKDYNRFIIIDFPIESSFHKASALPNPEPFLAEENARFLVKLLLLNRLFVTPSFSGSQSGKKPGLMRALPNVTNEAHAQKPKRKEAKAERSRG